MAYPSNLLNQTLTTYTLGWSENITAPTRTGPGLYLPVRYGDGVLCEPPATNLLQTPQVASTGSYLWSSFGTGRTITYSTTGGAINGGYMRAAGKANDDTRSGYYRVANAALAVSTVYYSVIHVRPSHTVTLTPLILDGTAFTTHATGTAVSCPGGVWTALSIEWTSASTIPVDGNILTVSRGGPAWPDDSYCDFSNGLTTRTDYPISYFDGSMGDGYAWTSTVNASTSTRTGSSNVWTLPDSIDVKPTVSVVCWYRPLDTPIQANITRGLVQLDDGTDANRFLMYSGGANGGTTVRTIASVPASVTAAGVTWVPGDVVFAGFSYTESTGTLQTWWGKQSASALTTSGPGSNVAVMPLLTTLRIGSTLTPANAGQANGAVEMVAIFNTALTSAEMAGLHTATSPIDPSDPRLLFYSASGDKAVIPSTTGLGYRTSTTTVSCTLPTPVSQIPTHTNTPPTAATHRIVATSGLFPGAGGIVKVTNSPYTWEIVEALPAATGSVDVYWVKAV